VRGKGLCPPRASSRVTEPRTVVERALKGERTPGEHRRAVPAWPGGGIVAERTPGGSKASKWACRPFTGEPSVGGKGTVRAAHLRVCRGDRTSVARNRRPGSCVPGLPSGGLAWQRAGAIRGKRPRSSCRRCAGGSRIANPQGSRRPARAGTAPREGKALEGKLQGRERHERRPRSVGGHGERRGPKGLERAASQPEPSRGARTLRTAPTRVWRSSSLTCDREEARDGEGAPGVVVSEGARTSREADPQVLKRFGSFSKGPDR
jgi:hypothetical protein